MANEPRSMTRDEAMGVPQAPSPDEPNSIPVSELFGPRKTGVVNADLLREGGAFTAAYAAAGNQPNNSEKRVREKFGKAYSEESFISKPGDFLLTSRIGYNDSAEGKLKALRSVYPEGDYKLYDMGEDGKVEMISKDGKTWNKLGGASTILSSIFNLENVGGLLGGPAADAGLIWKVAKPAVGAALGAFADQKVKELYDPDALDPYEQATASAVTNVLLGGVLEGVLAPLARRGGFIKGSPGAEQALDAAEEFSIKTDKGSVKPLVPLTKGQATDNKILQGTYKQVQNMYTTSREAALKRYESLGTALKGWIDENGLTSFSKPELDALSIHAAYQIDDKLRLLSRGKTPFGHIVGELQDALDIYNTTAAKSKNSAYQEAFDRATTDKVELDFSNVKNILDEVEKGVPVVTPASPSAGGFGELGSSEGDPNRYLTPDAKLRRLIAKARKNSDVLSVHNPDGNYVGALEQMNAVRREFSQFAWENAGSNQGRLAGKVLDSIDESIANPIAGMSDGYKEAFKKAQQQHGQWKAILSIRAMSNLERADPSTYQNYVTSLVKPGNGPLLELMDTMFKGTPGAMDAVRNTYIDFLTNTPSSVAKTLDNLQSKDPRLMQVLFPNKSDIGVIKTFAKDKLKLESSWFVQQTDLEMLTEGQRALDMLQGDTNAVANQVGDYLKFAGPNGKQAVQTAMLHKLLHASETESASLLGNPVVDADMFTSQIEKNRDLISLIFSPEEAKRLAHLENYALKIKETAVGVPSLKGRSGGDSGTSLQVASVGAKVGAAPGNIEKRGLIAAGKDLFTTFASPWLATRLLSLDSPVRRSATGQGSTRMSVESLQAIINYSRVASNAYIDAQSRHQDDSPFQDNVYTP